MYDKIVVIEFFKLKYGRFVLINKQHRPPRLPKILLGLLVDYQEKFSISGDIEEAYYEIQKENGFISAYFWFWFQSLISFPQYMSNIIYWGASMFRNYLKITFRSIAKQKLYALINIFGLALGLSCCILISAFIINELSFDRFHEKADNIYRVATRGSVGGTEFIVATSSSPIGPTFVKDFPDVVNYARLGPSPRVQFTYKDKKFYEEDLIYFEKSMFDIFSFELVRGNPETALEAAYTMVITEEAAEKYFGNEDPVGKILKRNNSRDFTITGIIKKPPANSHIQFDMIGSFESLISDNPQGFDGSTGNWGAVGMYTYILTREDCDYKEIEEKWAGMVDKYLGPIKTAFGADLQNFLQPLKSIHLYSNLRGELGASGSIDHIYVFSIIAVFILLIACINFMNLSTARSANRAKEVGLRKVFGAFRAQLKNQFLSESLFFALMSMLLALILVQIMKPYVFEIFGKEIHLNYLDMPLLSFGLIGVTVFVGLFAGSYPAFLLSRFESIEVLKGNLSLGAKNSYFRNILVVLQFSISIALIAGTGLILNQVHFMKNKNLGFNKDQLLTLTIRNDDQQKIKTAQEEMRSLPGVINAAKTSLLPGGTIPEIGLLPEGFGGQTNQAYIMAIINVDQDFVDTYEIDIIEGRAFSGELITDTLCVLINETAAKDLGWKDPVGKKINFPTGGTVEQIETTEVTVIGVFRDVHIRSMRSVIPPMVLTYGPSGNNFLSIRLKTENVSGTIDMIKEKWNKLFPNVTFSYNFIDEDFTRMYGEEEKFGTIIRTFSILAVFIGCLGLLGLASFSAQQRSREIGIRKTLGASIPSVTILLYKNFLILVSIAVVIAWPVSYLVMKKWIQTFPYQAGFNIGIFILSAMIALLIALVTVSYQTIKAGLTNPVEVLREK